MARKLRLEFPGAIYHVINRGNYRADVFQTAGAQAAFETCLFEAAQKSGWVLHAFVIMRNHFHLALETPAGNLVAGMQWLQSTFASRCNRLRGERGHLFQGRYKALGVEGDPALGQLCDYLHLNPVRAGAVPVSRLAGYRASSYWYLVRPKARPKCLHVATALTAAGGLADTPAGRRSYSDYLAWQAVEGPAGKNAAYVSMSRGWALGTTGFKAALIKDHAVAADARAWERQGAREIRELAWAALLQRCLRALGKSETAAQGERKGAPWKAAVALRLKETTQVSNRWLSEQLHLGRPEAVSVHLGRLRRGFPEKNADYRKLIAVV